MNQKIENEKIGTHAPTLKELVSSANKLSRKSKIDVYRHFFGVPRARAIDELRDMGEL